MQSQIRCARLSPRRTDAAGVNEQVRVEAAAMRLPGAERRQRTHRTQAYAYERQTHTLKHYVVYQRELKASCCPSPLLGNCPIMCRWWMEPLQMFYDGAIFILSSQ